MGVPKTGRFASAAMAASLVPASVARECILDQVKALEGARRRLRAKPGLPEALHGFRKRAHRLAASLELARPFLKSVAYHDLAARVSRVPKGLGKVRDADVLAARIRALASGKSSVLRQQLEAAAPRVSQKERERRLAAAARRAAPKRLRKAVARRLREMGGRATDPFGCLRVRLCQRSSGVSGATGLHALHALRLDLKDYRYALEATKPRQSDAAAALAKQARQATDLLGRIVDAHVLEDVARGASPLAKRTLMAAARKDMARARHAFAAAWTGPGLAALRASFQKP